jgi:BirA family biotin operon repressor/biotin-[acetyl-CoA-carboxylase] ligase
MTAAAPKRLPPFFDWVALATIDSTSEEAKRRAKAGAPAGLLVTARRQTAGRGRHQRVWQSAEGNLFASLVLRPACTPAKAAELSFVAAVAVADAIAAYLGAAQPVRCKWPNDILIAGRKAAGILLEAEPRGAAVDFVVVGIGVNLVAHPDGVAYPATDLAAAGADNVDSESFLIWLAARLLARYEEWEHRGFAAIRAAWLERAAGLGGDIVVELPGETLRGRFSTIDPTGALVLEAGGTARTISAGDVHFGPARAASA